MEVVVNDQRLTVAAGATIAALLEQLGMAAGRVAVEVNRELVPRQAHETYRLQESDRLEVVTLVGGG